MSGHAGAVQVDAFDHIYNHQRPHQGLPGRITPHTAWTATEKAEQPRPKPDLPFFPPRAITHPTPAPAHRDLPAGTHQRQLTSIGNFTLAGVTYKVAGRYGFHHVLVITDGTTVTVTDLDGEILIEHTRPSPGITYVGNDRPPGRRRPTTPPSPKS